MIDRTSEEPNQTVVIGGGQSGLSVGYQLAKRRLPFVILDASNRVGDTWRQRWDSLRLFTPAGYNGLAGMPFPASPQHFPTKDEMGDYLESYAARLRLPVENGTRVSRLGREGARFVLETNRGKRYAENVVVAMASYQKPRVPQLASGLDPDIVQLHSKDYRNPSQLQPGPALIVGAGNSGAEITMDVAKGRRTWVSGRDVGAIPFKIDSLKARLLVPLVLRGLFHRIATIDTPIGRKIRPVALRQGGPLIRTKRSHMADRGVRFGPRTTDISDGKPVLADGTVLDVKNIVWCTGYKPGFEWIDLPVHGDHEPKHVRGVVEDQPGLYFVGLHFLYALSSSMIQGLRRDAAHVVDHIASRQGDH